MLTNYTTSTIRFFVLTLGLLVVMIGSCKKDDDGPYQMKSDARDSAYLYTKDIYLWEEKLPSISVFKPRDLNDVYQVMDKVRTFQALDKWSFAETKAETEESQNGNTTDFGFMVKFAPGSSEIRVIYVYANSSAGQKGVKRTWRISEINGKVINRNVAADIDYINDIFFGNPQSAIFKFLKPDGNSETITLQKNTYTLNTVLFSNVYTVGVKKVGYFVFNEFSSNNSVIELVNTINDFQTQGVNEVIVDLRYNRGGFVSTQDTLANMLAPQSVGRGQKIMYTYKFNDKYSVLNESFKFYKVGTLDLRRIFFIVSPSSASASELLINNLKPVMADGVVLIGDTRTYGKPVGFFPIPVFEYNIFPVSFKTVNSVGAADYYAGFPVNKNVADDLIHEFGHVDEANLKQALYYINNGSFISSSSAGKISSVSSQEIEKVKALNAEMAEHLPSATIENRPSRMPPALRRLQR
ncbi:MAG: hypothetical protein H7Y13_02125 [Sphingobacteriaceae bacterium]|nr:hypothetical protein [Sphingobacteriaceae bacterium]